jgi:hypothetical protein
VDFFERCRTGAVADMIVSDYPAWQFIWKENTGCDEAVDEYMTWYQEEKTISPYPVNILLK